MVISDPIGDLLTRIRNAAKANDVDLDQGILRVMGKGGRERVLPIGVTTVKAIDRYLRARVRHPRAHLAALWLARDGALLSNSLTTCQMR